ncbi:MAG: protein tyrosine kinase [Desulfuromonas sp.]|nr:MAG: protein tyrosine kinase [Desulfuromonas sp.]
MNEHNETHSGMVPSAMEEVHLQDYLAVLQRRRKTFLITFLLVAIAVTGYTLMLQPVYELSTTMHVRDDKLRGNTMLEGLGLTQQNPVETEIEILKSRTNAEEVVRRLKLTWQISDADEGTRVNILEFSSTAEQPVYHLQLLGDGRYQVFNEKDVLLGEGIRGRRLQLDELVLLIDEIQGDPGQQMTLTLCSAADVVESLRRSLNASEVGKGTNIIRLSYQDTDPQRGVELVNTLATVYLERVITLKTEEARKSVDFIEQQLDEVRSFLDTAEQSLETYKRDSGILQLDAEAGVLIEQLTAVEKERSALSLQMRQLEFAHETLGQALEKGEDYAPAVLLDDSVVSGLANRLATLELERRALLVEVTPSHPAVERLDSQIRQAQNQLLALYKTNYRSLTVRYDALDQDLQRFEAQIKELPKAEQELARLTRLATVNADIYTFLLQKHEEARIARAATISNINIIDPAAVPQHPIKPNKRKNLLLGIIVGLMLGVGLAFFQEYLDDTIKDAETAKRALGLPALAVIPRIRHAETEEKTLSIAHALVTHHQPRSAPAEAFRSLRTALHFTAANQAAQVFLITSAFPGEGKTTISANLAEAFAQAGRKVLLIGCDLRIPTLHQIFGRDKSPGLTEYLVGDAELGQILHDTQSTDFHFISSGITPPNPAELLDSHAMQSLIDQLRQRYDTIILDAPPLLAVTDSSVLTAYADMSIVVVEAGGVKIKAAEHVSERLAMTAKPVAGFVLNDKFGKGAHYYGSYRGRYGYGYGYGYGYDGEGSTQQGRGSLLSRLFKG